MPHISSDDELSLCVCVCLSYSVLFFLLFYYLANHNFLTSIALVDLWRIWKNFHFHVISSLCVVRVGSLMSQLLIFSEHIHRNSNHSNINSIYILDTFLLFISLCTRAHWNPPLSWLTWSFCNNWFKCINLPVTKYCFHICCCPVLFDASDSIVHELHII